MAATPELQTPEEARVDDTNHDLIHSLSVRLDARWHDSTYGAETRCPGCQAAFARLRELDSEAIQLLTNELTRHVKVGRFPIDLVD